MMLVAESLSSERLKICGWIKRWTFCQYVQLKLLITTVFHIIRHVCLARQMFLLKVQLGQK